MNVFPRDHSWYQHRPGTTHGAHALHSRSVAEPCLAACDRRIMLDDATGGTALADAPTGLLCRRRGCVAARSETTDLKE